MWLINSFLIRFKGIPKECIIEKFLILLLIFICMRLYKLITLRMNSKINKMNGFAFEDIFFSFALCVNSFMVVILTGLLTQDKI